MRGSMTGKWERKSDTVWTYRVAGAARPYGYVGQYKDTGRVAAAWDATVTAGRLDDDSTVAEGVSFDEAKAALERHAQQQTDRVDWVRDRGTGP